VINEEKKGDRRERGEEKAEEGTRGQLPRMS